MIHWNPFPDGLGVRIPGFHPGGPGSIPGLGVFLNFQLYVLYFCKTVGKISRTCPKSKLYYQSVPQENIHFRFYLRIKDNLSFRICQYALCSAGLLRQRFDLFTVNDKRHA